MNRINERASTRSALKHNKTDPRSSEHIERRAGFEITAKCGIDTRIGIVALIEQIIDADKYRAFEPAMLLFPSQQQLPQGVGMVGDGIDIVHEKLPYPMYMELSKQAGGMAVAYPALPPMFW